MPGVNVESQVSHTKEADAYVSCVKSRVHNDARMLFLEGLRIFPGKSRGMLVFQNFSREGVISKKLFGKYIQVCQLVKHLTNFKRTKLFAYINKLGSQAVQNIAERIGRACTLFLGSQARGRMIDAKVKTITVKHDAESTCSKCRELPRRKEGYHT